MKYAACLCILAALCILATAQTQRPAFEVASVKAGAPAGAGPLRVTAPDEPAAINYTNVTLANCIRKAYGVRPFQIFGGPEWINSARFVINAKAASAVPKAQLMAMLQSLLEERFKLAAHREMKELAVYELTVAKSGLKLKEVSGESGTMIDSSPQHPLIARAVGMEMLAGAIRLDRPVFDATGLKGLYDLTLDYPQDDPFAVIAALQEQAGIKVVQSKRMVEALVIDRAEMPTGN
jgi:uncharacterized protein (TIGR03435 family)